MPASTPQAFIPLVGIARLAAEGTSLVEKSRVEYRTLPTRKWLNRCHSTRVPFQWTINPYRGCEYGCKYCYARFTHEFLELRDPVAFETEIYAKDWNVESFRKELNRLRPGDVVGLGTATDPYQPAERRFGRTRALLEAMAGVRGITLFITTKSDLVARDADQFLAIGRQNDVRVTVSVTTSDAKLARQTEPFAPRPDLRLQAVHNLATAGVSVGVIASPVLPLLTDSRAHLQSVASAAKAAGANFFGAGVLFLKPEARKMFFRFLSEHYPQHLARYQANYRASAYLQGTYPERIGRMVEEIRAEFAFVSRYRAFQPAPAPPGAQLRLF